MCIGKGTYRSLAAADKAANDVIQSRVGSTEHVYGYRCFFGNHYHFGHNKDRDWIKQQEEV